MWSYIGLYLWCDGIATYVNMSCKIQYMYGRYHACVNAYFCVNHTYACKYNTCVFTVKCWASFEA